MTDKSSPTPSGEDATPQRIFVFGSNLAGVHGAGSAKAAMKFHGAQRGVGVGPTGNSYAIPTKKTYRDAAMPLHEIVGHVKEFVRYAASRPELTFDVVRIGCGFAGYEDWQIAPMFISAPDNVNLPYGWRTLAMGVFRSVAEQLATEEEAR